MKFLILTQASNNLPFNHGNVIQELLNLAQTEENCFKRSQVEQPVSLWAKHVAGYLLCGY